MQEELDKPERDKQSTYMFERIYVPTIYNTIVEMELISVMVAHN